MKRSPLCLLLLLVLCYYVSVCMKLSCITLVWCVGLISVCTVTNVSDIWDWDISWWILIWNFDCWRFSLFSLVKTNVWDYVCGFDCRVTFCVWFWPQGDILCVVLTAGWHSVCVSDRRSSPSSPLQHHTADPPLQPAKTVLRCRQGRPVFCGRFGWVHVVSSSER